MYNHYKQDLRLCSVHTTESGCWIIDGILFLLRGNGNFRRAPSHPKERQRKAYVMVAVSKMENDKNRNSWITV